MSICFFRTGMLCSIFCSELQSMGRSQCRLDELVSVFVRPFQSLQSFIYKLLFVNCVSLFHCSCRNYHCQDAISPLPYTTYISGYQLLSVPPPCLAFGHFLKAKLLHQNILTKYFQNCLLRYELAHPSVS